MPDKPEAQAAAEEELLKRLVELNAQRAAEEAQGHIRWLRPEYQNPEGTTACQTQLDTGTAADTEATTTAAKTTGKIAWPKTMRDQIAAVRTALATAPQTPSQLASQFRRNPVAGVQAVLEALDELGMVTVQDELYTLGSGS